MIQFDTCSAIGEKEIGILPQGLGSPSSTEDTQPYVETNAQRSPRIWTCFLQEATDVECLARV